VAESLVALAQGASALGDPDRAQLAAGHAMKVAIQRYEAEQRLAAERVLESLRTVRMGAPAHVLQPPPAAPADPEDAGINLAEHLVAALAAPLPTEFAE
jgi:hypothetical protein